MGAKLPQTPSWDVRVRFCFIRKKCRVSKEQRKKLNRKMKVLGLKKDFDCWLAPSGLPASSHKELFHILDFLGECVCYEGISFMQEWDDRCVNRKAERSDPPF